MADDRPEHGEGSENGTQTNRRRLLGALTAAGMAGLAGCGSSGGGGSTGGGGGGLGLGTGTGSGGGGSGGGSSTSGSTDVAARSLSLPSGSCEQSARSSQRTLEESRVESDTTLGTDADVVVAQAGLRVGGGATLTVAPGTTIVFPQRTGLRVEGTLEASGSCSSPVALVGGQDRQGFWRGVTFGRNGAGTLEHVLVENGGPERGAGVTVRSDGLVEISNTQVRGSAGAGVAMPQTGGSLAAFSGNALADNAGAAVTGPVAAMAGLDGATEYGSASENPVVVQTSTVPEGETVAVADAGVPYTVAPGGRGQLTVNGTLEVGPGTDFLFGPESLLRVTGTGALVADASGGDAITFRGTRDTAGSWLGIDFRNATSTDNVLRNVELANAGSGDGQALRLGGESRLTVEDSTVRGSENYGVRIEQGAQVGSFDRNTVTGNAVPVWTSAQSARHVGPTNDLTGNDDDRVHVFAGEFDGHVIPEDEEHVWSNSGVPFLLERARGAALGVYGSLGLEPGLTLQMAEGHGVYVTGELQSLVEPDDVPDDYEFTDPPEVFVTFEGDQETAGYWKGIAFDDSPSTDNSLLFTEITQAGGGRAPAATEQREAAVMVLRGSSLLLRGASIRQSAGFGVFAQRDNELREMDFIHFDRTAAPVYIYADSVDKVGSSFRLENNESDLINVESPIEGIQRDLTWPNAGVPFRVRPSQVDNTLSINAEVTIRKNAELRFEQGVGVLVTREGELLVDGFGDPPSDPNTVLRGVQATPGYWQGIRYSETTKTDNRITNTGIYHTGSAPHPDLVETEPKRAAVAATGAAEATVENCHIADSKGAAFAAAYTSNPNREDAVNSTINTSGNVIE